MTTIPTHAQLSVEKIETDNGYTIIKEYEKLIPKTYNYSLHIIDLEPIEMTILELKNSIHEIISNLTEISCRQLLEELDFLLTKLLTLKTGHHSIHKRGLINFLGTISKWISGTMDDEDRQIINEHLETIDSNTGNIVSNINQQIKINNNLNDTIYKLYHAIEDDRRTIQNLITIKDNQTLTKLILLDLRMKIHEIDRLINDLQDNIIFTNLNIIHPSLLNHKEIIEYKIDINKLKNLRVGFTKTDTNKLIFLIKIPYKMTRINKKSIIPLSNEKDCKIINSEIIETLEINNHYYKFDNNKDIYQLSELKHCILNKNCEIVKNCNNEIYHINDNMIIVQLANNITLKSNIDERKFVLKGNYFIKFYNCTINIDNKLFSNSIKEEKNNFVIPNLDYKPINNTFTFKEIILETNKNIDEINLLKNDKVIQYSGGIIIIIVILIIIILLCYIFYKQKQFKIKQKEFRIKQTEFKFVNRTQESSESNEGRVTPLDIESNTNKNAHKTILY